VLQRPADCPALIQCQGQQAIAKMLAPVRHA
jgi:hypothetical protein